MTAAFFSSGLAGPAARRSENGFRRGRDSRNYPRYTAHAANREETSESDGTDQPHSHQEGLKTIKVDDRSRQNDSRQLKNPG